MPEPLEHIAKCEWKKIADRDKKSAGIRQPELPYDSICHPCKGYNQACNYYKTRYKK